MEASYAMVVERLERMLEQHRQGHVLPTQQEIDDLYTDACATVLVLEGERVGVERRLAEAVEHSPDDALTVRHSRDLARRRAEIDADLTALKSLSRFLRTAAEWSREPEAADVPGITR